MQNLNYGWRDAYVQRRQFERRIMGQPIHPMKHVRFSGLMVKGAILMASILCFVAFGLFAVGAA